jgi:hypothetical protein
MGASSKQPGIHPFTDVREAEKVIRMGEIQYNQEKLRDAFEWISADPEEAGRLLREHVLLFWFPEGRNRLHRIAEALFTGLAWCGLLVLALGRKRIAAYIAVIFALFPLVYYVLSSSARYRYPIDWIMLVLMAVALHGGIVGLLRRRRTKPAHMLPADDIAVSHQMARAQ